MHYVRSSSLLLLVAVIGACSSRAVVAPDLPPVPPALEACFDVTVAMPGASEWTEETVAGVIARLRQSELTKTRCGKQLLDFYADLRKELARTRN